MKSFYVFPSVHRFYFARVSIVFLIVLLGISMLFGVRTVNAQGTVFHVVRPGENLSQIAARYGVSYAQLAQHNRIANPNHLYVGQRLAIPSTTTYVPTIEASAPQTKPVVPPTNYTPPPAAAPVAPSRSGDGYYTVRRGDSLSGIAARYGVSTSAIMQRNSLGSSLIMVGQRLIIPANAPVSESASE